MKKFTLTLIITITAILLIAPFQASAKKTMTTESNKTAIDHSISKSKRLSKKNKKAEPLLKEKSAESKAEENKAEGESEPEEAAWKIKGWKVIFSILSVAFFGLAINLLPIAIADKNSKEHH